MDDQKLGIPSAGERPSPDIAPIVTSFFGCQSEQLWFSKGAAGSCDPGQGSPGNRKNCGKSDDVGLEVIITATKLHRLRAS